MKKYTKFGMAFEIAKRVIALSGKQNLGLNAAGVAFFSMLSLFPAMAALIAVFGLFLDPSVALEQTSALKSIIPAEAYGIIADQMEALISARTPTLGVTGIISIAIAIWTARMGVGAMMQGLNTICEVEDRGSLRHYFSSMILTMLLICVALVALGAVVVAPLVIAFFPPGADAESLFGSLRWGLALGSVIAGIGAIYRYGPNMAGRRVGWLTSGGLIVALAWFASSFAFSAYLSRFGNYNETYGSIGAVAALMMWFYISAYLILFGAAWNMTLRSLQRPPEG